MIHSANEFALDQNLFEGALEVVVVGSRTFRNLHFCWVVSVVERVTDDELVRCMALFLAVRRREKLIQVMLSVKVLVALRAIHYGNVILRLVLPSIEL